jgi:phage baseplate assembly protein W
VKVFRYPFNLDKSGGFATTTDYNQVVRGQVIDAVMTNQGERVMRPRYGCDIQAMLFDPEDELVRQDAASRVMSKLSTLVSRAIVRNVGINIHGRTVDTVFEPMVGTVVVSVSYRSSLYGTDTTVSMPSSSEFIRRQVQVS